MKAPTPPLLAALLLVFGIQSVQAAGLPDLGDSSRVALSESQENQIGREIMRQVRGDAEYLDDPVLEDYLNNLGDKLAAASPESGRHFEYFPVRDPSINAFAMPGGNIGVNTGLISATRNESELAGVLAHETAHVTQHHIARMVGDQKISGIATLAALAVAILAARSNSQASEAAIATVQALNIQNQLNFTRANESEADRVGLQILTGAGFAPQGMVTFFERLQAQGRLYENNAPAYMRTHPLTYQRIADMQNMVAQLPYKQHVDSLEFQFVRARIQANEGEAADALRRFEALAQTNPEPANWYGLARAAVRAGKPERAHSALTRLDADKVNTPVVLALEAELALSERQPGRAIRLLAGAMPAYASYRPLAYLYARALLAAGKAREALIFIGEQQRTWTSDTRLYALLAEAHQALGELTQSHLAQAESYALQDRQSAAIEQLQLAQKTGGADFYTLSIIDARLREMKLRQQAAKAEK
ncbi:MAG: M48 family metalloprotease [Gallionellaceae bacterium]|nr:M48 family metalloprotease [Gallionellaceae bacterium]